MVAKGSVLFWIAFRIACWVVQCSQNAEALSNLPLWTRRDIVESSMLVFSSWTFPLPITNNNDRQSVSQRNKRGAIVRLPLRFLPNAGCWAVRVTLTDKKNQDFNYYAVLDTGSPFLTCPPPLGLKRTLPAPKSSSLSQQKDTVSTEQYGESVGDMTWRQASMVALGKVSPLPFQDDQDAKTSDMAGQAVLSSASSNNVILGVPTLEMIKETGGIYVGLMDRDDYRPTVLEQFFGGRTATTSNKYGGACFEIQFQNDTIQFAQYDNVRLDNENYAPPPLSIPSNDPNALKLVDLSPYGPDLHHYGVLLSDTLRVTWSCNNNQGNQKIQTTLQTIPISSLRRPVVAVLDTGLTGCIFSDSLYEELLEHHPPRNNSHKRRAKEETSYTLEALNVTLPTIGNGPIRLSSNDQYWRFASFRLPWFYNEIDHPHVIALGCTFWTNADCVESLTIDTLTRRAKIKANS